MARAAGAGGGARVPDLRDEARDARATPGNPAARGQVRQRHLHLRARLLHPAASPEDHRRGAHLGGAAQRAGEDGKGQCWLVSTQQCGDAVRRVKDGHFLRL